MKDARQKKTNTDTGEPDNQPDPIEGRPDDDETEFPRKHTEQHREMKPGTMNREEIRERTHRNKE